MCGEEWRRRLLAFVRTVLVRRLHLATDRHIKHPYDNTMVHNGNHGPAYWISLYAPITVTSHPVLCGTGPGWT
jgi:hypothetical protein